jgi:hypothetical protein
VTKVCSGDVEWVPCHHGMECPQVADGDMEGNCNCTE